MPFSWEAARQPLVSGGMGIVQSLLQEGARKKEEERLIEREKRQYDLFLKELDKKFEKNKELAEFRKELDADYDRKLKGNLDLNRLYDEAALPNASAEIKALVEGVKTINQKQLNFIAMGEGDYAFDQKLIDAGFGAIPYIFHEREMNNAQLIKQLEARDRESEAKLALAESREKELSLLRGLTVEQKGLAIEEKKTEKKEKEVKGRQEAVDARDKATGQLIELLNSKGLLQYDPVTKSWGARQFTKRKSIFNEKGKIAEEAKIAILKKHPELRPFFNEVEKYTKRVEALEGIPEEQAEGDILSDGKTYIVGEEYIVNGVKVRYLGNNQFEPIE